MLIQGAAGCGKSYFGRAMQDILTDKRGKGDRIPIYIQIVNYKDIKINLVPEVLGKLNLLEKEVSTLQESGVGLVLILDGYDEQSKAKVNLYKSNNLSQWKNTKVIFLCRSEALSGSYQNQFVEDKKAFTDIVMLPFDDSQISQYLERYLKDNSDSVGDQKWRDPKVYHTNINKISGLRELVSKPFILSMLVSVLPALIEPPQEDDGDDKLIDLKNRRFLSRDLFEVFMSRWFDIQINKLSVNTTCGPMEKCEYEEFAQKLSAAMHELQVEKVDEALLNEDDESHAKLKQFFDGEINRNRLHGIPLTKSGTEHRFIQRAMSDYFAARAAIQDIKQIANAIVATQTQRKGRKQTNKCFDLFFCNNLITDKGML